MRMLFKQRFFSWFDSYDIWDEAGRTMFTVRGQLSWGHCLKVFDPYDNEVGTVRERILTLLPQFEIYLGDTYMGCVRREFSFLRPRYNIDYCGWEVQGDLMEWDYAVTDRLGRHVAQVSKELLHWTDTYSIDVPDPRDALNALMLVLAIDAEKCSRDG